MLKKTLNRLASLLGIKRQFFLLPIPSDRHRSISYAITVCNEAEELERLIGFLSVYLQPGDEIVIQADSKHVTPEVQTLIGRIQEPPIRYTEFLLDRDFAAAKNHLNEQCQCEYIFQLDADEMPSVPFMEQLQEMLAANGEIDLFKIPRYNIFHYSNDRPTEFGLGWPDYQGRLYKNNPACIYWRRPLHERIHGYRTYTYIPAVKELAITHSKEGYKDHIKWVTWDQNEKRK